MSILSMVLKDVLGGRSTHGPRYSRKQYAKLHAFIQARVSEDVYAEPIDPGHTLVTHQVLERINEKWCLRGKRVLDVGCGRGIALEKLAEYGAIPTGLTFGDDFAECKRKGYDVFQMDMSFVDFPDETFDMIWARHSLEHSLFPYFTLHVLSSTLKRGGLFYVEVPAPDTSANHQTNRNHYSCLTRSSWKSLFERTGLRIIESFDIEVPLQCGPDVWYSFYLEKP